ncbi:MAG: hypothetical protein DDT21_01891 [Syntrophomonadaceae bacterium]|nr:hypothetical protein [Bacillota bacterium]
MDALTNAEREVHLSMVADKHDTWEVYADDPMWVARLDKIATAYKTTPIGKWYKLTAGQVTIKKESSPLSEAEKQRRRETMAKALGRSI